MPRKKRQQDKGNLPQATDDVWEVGCRTLGGAMGMAPQGGPSEFAFVVQTSEPGGVVYGDPIMPDAPDTILVEVIQQAMRAPLFGSPRRPGVVLVNSQDDADILSQTLSDANITLEVVPQLDTLDALCSQMTQMLDSMNSDYRTRAAQAGESLSDDGLREVFGMARQFHRRKPWTIYDDTELFSLSLQPGDGPAKTLYGIIMGQMGAEFGLVLYTSLDALQQMYDIDLDELDQLPSSFTNGQSADADAWKESAEMAAELLAIPSISLTFNTQQEAPPQIVQEAKQLKLPLANRSAYPLMLRTGQGGMQIATASDLGDMYVAMRAILAWDDYIESEEAEDDEDERLTVEQPAIEGFLPAMTVEVTLIDNPYSPENEFDDEFDDDEFDDDDDDFDLDLSEAEMSNLLEAMENMLSAFNEAPPRKKSTPKKAPPKAKPNTNPKTAQVYTFGVYLVGGPIDDAYVDQEISRQIDVLGHQTLHDLHQAIFEAFEREEEHLYEFNLGESPQDRSQLYFYQGSWGLDDDDDERGDPTSTTIDELGLEPGQRFGYIFDMGDQWEHVIDLLNVKTGAGKGPYPKLGKKVGSSPPQYPDFDDEDDEDFD
jgi:hypothetical protein